jgi:hypothetical protein
MRMGLAAFLFPVLSSVGCGVPSTPGSVNPVPSERTEVVDLSLGAIRAATSPLQIEATTAPVLTTAPAAGETTVHAHIRRIKHPLVRSPSLAGETSEAIFTVDLGSTVPGHAQCGVIALRYDEFAALPRPFDEGSPWEIVFDGDGRCVGLH